MLNKLHLRLHNHIWTNKRRQDFNFRFKNWRKIIGYKIRFITIVILEKENATFGIVNYRKFAVQSPPPPPRKVWPITLIINYNNNNTVWCSKLDYKWIKSECQHKIKLFILNLNQIIKYITVFKRYGFFRNKNNTIIYNA